MSFETDGDIHPMVECSQKKERMNQRKSGTPKRLWDDCFKLSPKLGPIVHMASTN